MESIQLYPGIELSMLTLSENNILTFHHEPWEHIMEINYCIAGRLDWEMRNGSHVFLSAGDFVVHTMQVCTNSQVRLPTGSYHGFTLFIHLKQLTQNPPDLLAEIPFCGKFLYKKFCQNNTFTFFAGTEETDAIFRWFYHQPQPLQQIYQKIKVLELILYLYQTEPRPEQRLTECQTDQIVIVHQIHEQLLSNLNQRITIEALSKQYLMNPTTLKHAFKSVYGMSIAAHMKQHRMERAAIELVESDKSIAQIAADVGYESQSKFSVTFKEYFHMLPKDYRKVKSTHTK